MMRLQCLEELTAHLCAFILMVLASFLLFFGCGKSVQMFTIPFLLVHSSDMIVLYIQNQGFTQSSLSSLFLFFLQNKDPWPKGEHAQGQQRNTAQSKGSPSRKPEGLLFRSKVCWFTP